MAKAMLSQPLMYSGRMNARIDCGKVDFDYKLSAKSKRSEEIISAAGYPLIKKRPKSK